MLTLEDSINYTRGHFNNMYPKSESRRKTIGNIPERLHTQLHEYADANSASVYEVIAGLWDFHLHYESINAAKLETHRAKTTPRHT